VRTSSAAGVFSIQWVNVNEFTFVPTKSFRCRLFSTGNIEFSYSGGMNTEGGFVSIGVSPGNGTADPDGPGDLSTNPSSTDSIIYEDVFSVGGFDLGGSIIRFNAAAGGYNVTTLCASARHEAYGDGCYDIAQQAYYEDFVFSTTTPFDLSNSSLSMLLTGNGYLVLAGASAFVPPSGTATVLTLGDDDEAPVTLSAPLVFPGGTTTTLTVCSNGFVSAGAGNGTNFFPDPFEHLNSPDTAWRSWRDMDPTQAGSGQVKFEQIGSIAYVTWDGVFSFGSSLANTMQFQFDTSSGAVHMIWQTMAGASNDILVGYAPGGTSVDPGNLDISVALPTSFQLAPDLQPLTLAAAPPPVSTATTGTVVTFTTSNMPALAPGVFVGLHILSVNQAPAPGIDLAILGAPGCFAHVATIGPTQAIVGTSPTQTVTLTIPPGIPAGTQLFSQSVALFPPNSLPGGLNAFGLLSSNGIASTIQPQ
jgi:hypothetical protein